MRLRSKRSTNNDLSSTPDDVTPTDTSDSYTASRDSSVERLPERTRRSTRGKATPTPSKKDTSSRSTHVARKSMKRLKLSPCKSPLYKHTLLTGTQGDSSSDESVSIVTPKPVKDQMEVARQCLRVSSVPDSLPGREGEFSNVYSFLKGKLTTKSGGCMYISGVPGTGKTATSLGVIARLQKEVGGSKKIPRFIFSHLNGMQLSQPEHLYTRLAQTVFEQKKRISAEKCLQMLNGYFSEKDQKPVVVLLDEVDLLCVRKQTLLYNLFDWTARPGTKLSVLAIANTMDLPERAFAGRVASRIGLTRTIFQPYSFRQLQTIIQDRLKKIPAFNPEAIELVSRKVAAVSGDARRALDICRRATEMSERGDTGKIGMTEVDRALGEMFSSLKVYAVKGACIYEQLFLRSVLSAVKESELEEVPVRSVLRNLDGLAHFQGLPPPSHTEAFRSLSSLVGSKLLLTTGSPTAQLMLKISLNISTDDLSFALKSVHIEDFNTF